MITFLNICSISQYLTKNKKTYKELILFATENDISDKTIKLALENKVLIPFYEHPKKIDVT